MIPADFEEEVRKVDEKGVDVIVDFGEPRTLDITMAWLIISKWDPTTGTRYGRYRNGKLTIH